MASFLGVGQGQCPMQCVASFTTRPTGQPLFGSSVPANVSTASAGNRQPFTLCLHGCRCISMPGVLMAAGILAAMAVVVDGAGLISSSILINLLKYWPLLGGCIFMRDPGFVRLTGSHDCIPKRGLKFLNICSLPTDTRWLGQWQSLRISKNITCLFLSSKAQVLTFGFSALCQ